MTANRTGGSGKAGRQRLQDDGELQVMRLAGLLEDLKRKHGSYGAAEELGVSYKMLRRSETAGRLSDALREALERYLVDGPPNESSPWWKRVEHAEAEIRAFKSDVLGDVERVMQAVRELADDIARHRDETQRVVGAVEAKIEEVRALGIDAQPAVANGTQPEQAVHSTQGEPLPDASVEGPVRVFEAVRPLQGALSDGPGGNTVGDLIAGWGAADERERRARTRLERSVAELAKLRVGLELVREHWLLMPQRHRLDELQRSRELERHWHGIEALQRQHGRLARRRWIRRTLTLGLWWS